jgi:transcription elongation factor GreB
VVERFFGEVPETVGANSWRFVAGKARIGLTLWSKLLDPTPCVFEQKQELPLSQRRSRITKSGIETSSLFIDWMRQHRSNAGLLGHQKRTPDSVLQEPTILGIDEVDSSQAQVSWVSPIARTLLKAHSGDVLQLLTPAGKVEIEVVDVQYPAPGM